jgi:hypothetical protein
MKTREVAQCVRDFEILVEPDLLARDDIDRSRKLAERARRGRSSDDESLDVVGIVRLRSWGFSSR